MASITLPIFRPQNYTSGYFIFLFVLATLPTLLQSGQTLEAPVQPLSVKNIEQVLTELANKKEDIPVLMVNYKKDLEIIINALLATFNNTIVTILKNRHLVPVSKAPAAKSATREEPDARFVWIFNLSSQLVAALESLKKCTQPTPGQLKQLCAVVNACAEAAYEGMEQDFVPEVLRVPTPAEISIRLTAARDTNAPSVEKFIAARPVTKAPQLSSAELLEIATVHDYMTALIEIQHGLAQRAQSYGLSPLNKTAVKAEKLFQKCINYKYTPVLAVTAIFIATAAIIRYVYTIPNYKKQKWFGWDGLNKWTATAGGMFLYQMAQTTGSGVWVFTSTQLSRLKNQFSSWWTYCKGVRTKEKIGSFDLLTRDDCEGEEEPVIGLRAQFNRVMGSVESTLRRMQIGEREPFKGVQRTFIFVGSSGTGKTFLANQLKIRIAALREELGIEIAYVHLGAMNLVFGDLLAHIQEAQKKGVGLVLWVDELHLMKPHKDGQTPLLEQLLQTEIVNKSNTPIWIFAATNEPGRFDNALIRSGRFEVINIYDLTFADRIEFFDFYARQQGLILDKKDLCSFAAQTHQASPATLRKVINAAGAAGKALTREHIQEEILRLVFHVIPGFEELSPAEQQEIAVYQAGRGLVHLLSSLKQDPQAAALYTSGMRFALITTAAIERSPQELPAFVMDPVSGGNPNLVNRRLFGSFFSFNGREQIGEEQTAQGKERLILELVAGMCAQNIVLKNAVDTLRKDDLKRAHEYCLDLARNGKSVDFLSRAENERCKDKALELLQKAEEDARALLQEHRMVLDALTAFFMQNAQQPHLFAENVLRLLEKEAQLKQQKTKSEKTAS